MIIRRQRVSYWLPNLCCVTERTAALIFCRGLADAFAKHALKLTRETGGTVAMLMNVSGLCDPMRHDFYVGQPPAVIYALDECICWPYGDPSRATTSITRQRYVWIVWKAGHEGPTHLTLALDPTAPKLAGYPMRADNALLAMERQRWAISGPTRKGCRELRLSPAPDTCVVLHLGCASGHRLTMRMPR